MSAIRKFCTKAALIDKSQLIEVGSPEKIATLYENINLRAAGERIKEQNAQQEAAPLRDGTRQATIEKVETYNANTGKPQETFTPDEKIGVRIRFAAHEKLEKPAMGFIFQDQEDITVFATNTFRKDKKIRTVKQGEAIILETVVDNVFTDGEYTITCAIESDDLLVVYDRIKYIHTFMIGGHPQSHSKVHPHHTMDVSYA
jgi:hypothetical protein